MASHAATSPASQALPCPGTPPDEALLSALYVAHAPGLRRWLAVRTRDDALAEDLVQEAFIRLALEIRRGRTPDNPLAWLTQVARNAATSRARHAAVVTRFEPLLPRPDAPEDPAAAAVTAERAAAVHDALRRLSPDDRTALVLAASGHHNAEIAVVLGRTELATRALLHRARRRLRPGLAAFA